MPNEVGIFFSFVFALVGVSHFVCPREWEAFFRDLGEKSYAGLVIAIFSLPIGMLILSFHNNWALDFPLFVTLAGWGLTLKSLVYLLYPELPSKKLLKRKKLARDIRIVGFFMMLFGGLSALSHYW